MNTSAEPVILVAGTTVAEFYPLFISGSIAWCNSRDIKSFLAVHAVTVSEALGYKVTEAIDPSLNTLEKQKLEQLVLDYPDFQTNLDMLMWLTIR